MKITQTDVDSGKSTVISEFDFICLGWYGKESQHITTLRSGHTIDFNGYRFKQVVIGKV